MEPTFGVEAPYLRPFAGTTCILLYNDDNIINMAVQMDGHNGDLNLNAWDPNHGWQVGDKILCAPKAVSHTICVQKPTKNNKNVNQLLWKYTLLVCREFCPPLGWYSQATRDLRFLLPTTRDVVIMIKTFPSNPRKFINFLKQTDWSGWRVIQDWESPETWSPVSRVVYTNHPYDSAHSLFDKTLEVKYYKN